MGSFSIGMVLGTGFRVWFRNLIPFLFITLLVYVPYLIWAVLLVQGDPSVGVRFEDVKLLVGVTLFVTPLLNILASSALVYGVVMELSGERASVFRCIGTGLARFFPVLGVALLTMLAILGGVLALIIPGLIVLCTLYVTTGVAVLERPGLFGALARSSELTSGHRWRIFGIVVLLGLLNLGLQFVVGLVMSTEPAQTAEVFHDNVRRNVYVDLVRLVLIGSLSAVMSATTYFYLRRAKEGTSAGELSKVFE